MFARLMGAVVGLTVAGMMTAASAATYHVTDYFTASDFIRWDSNSVCCPSPRCLLRVSSSVPYTMGDTEEPIVSPTGISLKQPCKRHRSR
jgi:hypothetical protein